MASLIKGIPVTLYERTQTGNDAFGAPVYDEAAVIVDNVIVSPVAASDVIDDLNLYGRHAVYELCIPKSDSHDWVGCRVDFFGESWRTFGPEVRYMASQVPLDWNRKIKVERYG